MTADQDERTVDETASTMDRDAILRRRRTFIAAAMGALIGASACDDCGSPMACLSPPMVEDDPPTAPCLTPMIPDDPPPTTGPGPCLSAPAPCLSVAPPAGESVEAPPATEG